MLVRKDITVKASLDSIPQIRDMLERVMISSRFSKCEILEAQLALEEVYTNIALYAYPSGDGNVRISSEVDGDMLIIDIEDSGVPFDIVCHKTKLPSGKAEDWPIGGIGIYLIKNLMNDVSYQRIDGKNILRLTKIHSA
ncbi:MAG: ATP-binding protein [Methanotrichaceae archaeon]